MLNNILHFSIKKKLIIGVMTIALVIWGLWSASKFPVDALPDVTNNEVEDYIFIVDPVDAKKETHFKRIPVAIGTSNVGDSEITLLKEVPADAKVLMKGSFFILAMQTNTEGHDD